MKRTTAFQKGAIIISALSCLFILIPLISIVLLSFNTGTSTWPQGWTLKWYFYNLSAIWSSLLVSVYVALGAVVIALLIAFPCAVAIARYAFPGRYIMEQALMLPVLIPGVVLGMILLQLFQTTSLKVLPPLAWLIIAHVLIVFPLIVRPLIAALEKVDQRLEEAAQSLGAKPVQAFWHVAIPAVAPTTLVAVLLAVARSFNDFIITLFLISPDYIPLSIQVYKSTLWGIPQLTSAISVILLGMSILVVLVIERFLRVEY